jgi:hypothetical protein
MSLLLPSTPSEPNPLGSVVKRGYRLLQKPRGRPLSPREEDLLFELCAYIHAALMNVLQNIEAFEVKDGFLDAVDRLA